MEYEKRRPSLSLILVVALLILLPVLAALQYSWVGQVSRGERGRMEENLRSGATRFSRDFNRELTRAFLNFQVDPSAPPKDIWDEFSSCYKQWFASAPYPGLVSGVFLTESDESGSLSLSSFDQETGRFKPDEWPDRFADLRRRFEQYYHQKSEIEKLRAQIGSGFALALPRAIQKEQTPSLKVNVLFGSSVQSIDGEIPALIVPAYFLSDLNAGIKIDSRPAFRFIIIALDLDYIKREIIPALARRYFASGDALDYNLAILSRSDSKRLIYQSDANLSGDALSSSDATVSLFNILFDEIRDLSAENLPGKNTGEGEEKSQTSRLAVSVIRQPSARDVLPINPADHEVGQWQLLLKHRVGSLEAVVASARRRNLAISFGVLLLLGFSVTIIIISARRAERLARQQMEFVAGVSHELRTPLAVIRSAGENLADGVIEDRQQVQSYGSLIAGEGRRLTEMVEQVLEFSGIQSGRKAYELLPVEVGDLIESALSSCNPLIDEGGFIVEKEIQSYLPPVAADRLALSRAIQNLINNAIKYSGDSRWMKIKAQTVSSSRSPEVHITVEDRGLGIAANDLPHIFEPFHRGREATAAQIHGNGLGLSLVKHIVTAHGGSVEVESLSGRGSYFTLRLPVMADADDARSETSETAEMAKSDA